MQELDYSRIYDSMSRPAFLFDGRILLDHDALRKIGFHVESIGKRPSDRRMGCEAFDN